MCLRGIIKGVTMGERWQVTLKVELPTGLEIIMLLFIFSAEILGEINAFYIRIPAWDTILHTLNGFLMAAIGFSLVDILNRHERFSFQLSPAFMAVVAFCFSMTIGVLWEFFEWGMDMFFHLDIGLYDTMKDLFVNFIGAVVFSTVGFFYVKSRGKGSFARRFIPRLKSKDRDFLAIAEKEKEIRGAEKRDHQTGKQNRVEKKIEKQNKKPE